MNRDRKGLTGARAARLGVALLAVLTTGACTPLDNVMVAIFGRSMRSSVSFDPYENPRQPAPGAVPFASGNYPAGPGEVNLGEPEGLEEDVPPLTPADMGAPGSDLVNSIENPVPADSASLARGQVVYERMCAVCHGAEGRSVESRMVQEIAGMAVMESYELAEGNAVGYTDGYIYGMIRMGRGLMPSYGHRITHFDRWHAVNYVRELQRRAAPDEAGAGEGQAGDAGEDQTGDAGPALAGQGG